MTGITTAIGVSIMIAIGVSITIAGTSTTTAISAAKRASEVRVEQSAGKLPGGLTPADVVSRN